MKSWRRWILSLLTVLTLAACSLRNAPQPSQPQGDSLTGAESPPVAAKVDFTYGGSPSLITATFTAEQLTVLLNDKPVQHMDNPFGEDARVKLAAIERPDTSHLLVTAADDRTTYAWVLVPDAKGFRVALELVVDEDVSVSGTVVEARHREYESSGGYHLVMVRYGFSPETGAYERVTP